MELLSLSQYTQIAEKFLNSYFQYVGKVPKGFDYDDALTDVISTLVKSDLAYRTDHHKGLTLRQYRSHNCVRTMLRFRERAQRYRQLKQNYTKKLKTRKISFNDDASKNVEHQENIKEIDYFISNSNLTQSQRDHIDLYLKGYKTSDIAKITGNSYENAFMTMRIAIRKMQKLVR